MNCRNRCRSVLVRNGYVRLDGDWLGWLLASRPHFGISAQTHPWHPTYFPERIILFPRTASELFLVFPSQFHLAASEELEPPPTQHVGCQRLHACGVLRDSKTSTRNPAHPSGDLISIILQRRHWEPLHMKTENKSSVVAVERVTHRSSRKTSQHPGQALVPTPSGRRRSRRCGTIIGQGWSLGRPDRTGPTEMVSACYNMLYPVRSPT